MKHGRAIVVMFLMSFPCLFGRAQNTAVIQKAAARQDELRQYHSRLRGTSYSNLVGHLDSTNTTEVSVAILVLRTEHSEMKGSLLPLFIDRANRVATEPTEDRSRVIAFIMGVEDLTGQDFHACYDGPTWSQCLEEMNSWWEKNKKQ